MMSTESLGNVTVTPDQLKAMHAGDYILHARDGKLTEVPCEKTKLPLDPAVQNHQQLGFQAAPDGTLYATQATQVSKSTDGGRTWTGPTGCNTGPCFLAANSYETMIAGMASRRLLAVIRYHGPVVSPWPLIDPDQHTQYKTVFLSDSEDGGTTWQNLRQLTNVHGQCHGYGVGLSDGTAVVAFDHRYPPGTPSGKAMVSRDEGRTWEDEVYYLYYGSVGSGFSQSVVLEGDVILTVGATSESTEARTGWDAGIGKADLVAIRWKPEKG